MVVSFILLQGCYLQKMGICNRGGDSHLSCIYHCKAMFPLDAVARDMSPFGFSF